MSNKDQSLVGGQHYNPNNPFPHGGEGATSKAVDCGLVLATRATDNTIEYRVGRFKSEAQVEAGLRRKDAPSELNPMVAKSCFGNSAVLSDEATALAMARRIAGARAGVKVLHMHCPFPN